MTAEVIVVGSVNVDLVVRVASLPRPGETVAGGRFSRHHGGKGANQAVAAARLGARVRFVGAVGDDEMGREATSMLAAEGIDTSGVNVMNDAPTGVALITVDDQGENQIAVASGANARLDTAWVRGIMSANPPPRTGVMLLGLEVGDEPLLEAARLGRSAGATVILDVAPARPFAAELLQSADILKANRAEACLLAGVTEPEAAASALAGRIGGPVVVTLGPRGALVADKDGIKTVAGHLVEAADTTGAGDAAAGALAAEMGGGASLLAALRTSMAAAALSVTVQGAREGMPRREALRGFGR